MKRRMKLFAWIAPITVVLIWMTVLILISVKYGHGGQIVW